jgi:hypothetical protein
MATTANNQRDAEKQVERLRDWFGLHLSGLEREEYQTHVDRFVGDVLAVRNSLATKVERPSVQERERLAQDWATIYRLAEEYQRADWPRSRRLNAWFVGAILDLAIQSVNRFQKLAFVNGLGMVCCALGFLLAVIPTRFHSLWWLATGIVAQQVCWWLAAIYFDVVRGPHGGPSDLAFRAALPGTKHFIRSVRNEVAMDQWDAEEIAYRLRLLEARGVYLPSYVFSLLRASS